ncbi:MAG: MBOAT family protein [Firmicutes bacterium]|nr:MBOAT family protein [Bacillota bacterium]
MSFNSLEFLLFLPAVVLLYWLLPHKARWILLLAASYIFYMSWNVWLIGLILAVTVTAYVAGIAIDRADNRKAKKVWLIVTLIVCLGLLIFFKYINFILESAVGVIRLFDAGQEDIALNVILPVGISFYTFQTLSYVIDVYRGEFKAERHFGYFALYVSYFPQLVAGPIERPQNLLPQLKERHRLDEDDMRTGAKWLLSGFFRKCVVADFCGIFVDKVYADPGGANALAMFVASALFLIQIYNDFAGYSEIALGAARLMGVKLSKNFDKPLTSTSYTEFFRRWHITLNQWFTQYVYIPLGGNRKGTARKIINTLIVFTLCGLWHGANWTFVLWGLVAGIAVSIETLLKKFIKKPCGCTNADDEKTEFRLFRQIVIFILFTFSCVLFRSQSLNEAGVAFRQMFTAWGFGEEYMNAAMSSLGMSPAQIFQLTVAIAAMVFLYRLTAERRERQEGGLLTSAARTGEGTNVVVFVYGILAVALFWLALISSGDISGFEYFQF